MPDLNAPNEALRLIEKVKKQLKSIGAEVIEVRFYGMPENFWSAALFVLQHEFYICLLYTSPSPRD